MAGLISDLYVRPSARGGGLGRQLLDTGVDWLKAQGVKRLELQVVSGNQNAADFYKHLGWKLELSQLVQNVD
jgi:GNAT superfamily N-acetyltransferase